MIHLSLRLFLALAVSFCTGSLFALPVEFTFRPVEPVLRNPFSRDLWVEVTTPAGPVQAPAFYVGNGRWSVRLAPNQAGRYQLGPVVETDQPGSRPVEVIVESEAAVTIPADGVSPPAVRLDPRDPRFFLAGTESYYPIGINLAWAPRHDPDAFYPVAFGKFAAAGLNWTRVWMSHWGALNLDWRIPAQAPSPPLGQLDLEVAAHWDRVIAAAETAGVRVQVVLQHHGQVSTRVNSNWAENPWNVANGGFLRTPAEFFTSPTARELTRRKYRYIAARWGYSPAVLAWELFNESMYVDARYTPPLDNEAVAAWTAEMTRALRRYDIHRHLVTTSDNALDHLLQGPVDYLQPHLYGANMLAGVRAYDVDPAALDRPVFYGEVGPDNALGLTPAQIDSGVAAAPLLWSSVMGRGLLPAQPWYWERVFAHDRMGEFAAFSRFVRESDFARATAELTSITPLVTSDARVPLIIRPALNWKPAPNPVVEVPLDGREAPALADLARHLVNPLGPGAATYPSRLTLHVDYPHAATATLHFPGAGNDGGSLRVIVDSEVKAEHTWAPVPPPPPLTITETVAVPGDETYPPTLDTPPDAVAPSSPDATPAPNPAFAPRAPFVLSLPLAAGPHVIEISNVHGEDWIEFSGLETGLEVPALAAVGKSSADRIYLWVWHREGVFDLEPGPAVTGSVALPAVPPGEWTLTWWDGVTGEPSAPTAISHAGGALDVPTPPIARHAAARLERR